VRRRMRQRAGAWYIPPMRSHSRRLALRGLLASSLVIGAFGALAWSCSSPPSAAIAPATVIAPATARPEHPRPDLRRDSYISLNSTWQFAHDDDNVGLDERWFAPENRQPFTESVQIPFAWESPLSGLMPPHEGAYQYNPLKKPAHGAVAWYRLEL